MGGEGKEGGKRSVFFCLQHIDMCMSPVSMGCPADLAISKVFDAKWSISGTQTWQPCSGQQVVPPANILAIVLSWVATSTSSYRDNVLFFFIILFTKLSFVWGLLWSRQGEVVGGGGAEERRKAGEGKTLVQISRRLYGRGNGRGGAMVRVEVRVRALSLCFPWRAC